MEKKRNGLFEVYRFILCFLPLYYHNFFFWERNYEIFGIPELAVDFFFMMSGFFLMNSMKKLKEEKIIVGIGKIMFGRVKPMMFTLCFISAFNFLCVILFIRENYLDTLFDLFKYWWFVLYLSIAIGVLYFVYRILRKEKIFITFLVILALGMACLHYAVVVQGLFISELVFFTRAFGCLSAGILVSYIPKIKKWKLLPSILAIALLIPSLFYLAYAIKTFFVGLAMIFMFGALMYFSSHISLGGKVFDLIGQLSVRVYLYMAFITMFRILGLTNNRILFIIDVTIASMDLVVCYYRNKYLDLKKQVQIQK
jgi:peptidoglycan/LPS O-acetylase OafA/YrhL